VSGKPPFAFRYSISPGVALTVAAVLALAVSNSAWHESYLQLLQRPLGPDSLHLRKSLLLWVNDGMMALFFLLVGLEIKRELLTGELSSPRRMLLPCLAALGGMIVPALFYLALNHHDPVVARGWAIPCATDIAFALGVISLLGSRIPSALKLFLMAVAIIDDLGAILIIALFYTDALSLTMLGGASLCGLGLLAMNLAGVRRVAAYLLAGALLWYFVLKSGVHPTIAGVITALAIPLRCAQARSPTQSSVLEALEHRLEPWVEFGVLPMFAFCNAGLDLRGLGIDALLQPVTLGIMLGLVAGKAVGVFSTGCLLVGMGWADRPSGTGTLHGIGVACLCGIGFTMSLFIGSLAFGQSGPHADQVRMGVMGGSLIAATLGLLVLWIAAGRTVSPAGAR